jgi:hypothetical protein
LRAGRAQQLMRRLLPLLAVLLLGCPPEPLSLDGLDIQVVPTDPDEGEALTATVVAHVKAFEEEGFRYDYLWTVDGVSASSDLGREVPSELTLPGQIWIVTVTPIQETEEEVRTGPAAVDTVTISVDEEGA